MDKLDAQLEASQALLNLKRFNAGEARATIIDSATDSGGSPRSEIEWERKYKELLAYKSENGTCDVPTNHPILGRWVKRQRSKYKHFDLCSQSEEGRHYRRYLRLKAIGFKFVIGRGANQIGKKRGKYGKARDCKRDKMIKMD